MTEPVGALVANIDVENIINLSVDINKAENYDSYVKDGKSFFRTIKVESLSETTTNGVVVLLAKWEEVQPETVDALIQAKEAQRINDILELIAVEMTRRTEFDAKYAGF